MIRSAEIDTEHLAEGGVPAPIVRLRDAGYPVTIVERYATVSTKQGEDDTGYQPLLVRTLAKPPAEADAVEDEIDVPICHCGDFVYRQMADLEEGETPTSISPCKHWMSIDKGARAMDDDAQQKLALDENPVGK